LAKTFTKEYELIRHYQSLYVKRYNRPIEINRYKEKWAVSSLIEDFGYEEVEKTLEYYFKLDKDGHPLSWFFSNFSIIKQRRLDKEMDDIIRADRRAKTQKIVEEYRNGLS
jgi:predicted hydrolase (HD superfamily)